MSDVIYVLLTLVVFVLLALLVGLLDRGNEPITAAAVVSPQAGEEL